MLCYDLGMPSISEGKYTRARSMPSISGWKSKVNRGWLFDLSSFIGEARRFHICFVALEALGRPKLEDLGV